MPSEHDESLLNQKTIFVLSDDDRVARVADVDNLQAEQLVRNVRVVAVDHNMNGVTRRLAAADRDRLVGVYAFGATDAERFDVAVTKTGGLAIKRLPGGSARNLFHQGGSTFHPPGNSSIRIAFEPESGAVQRLVLREGAGSVVATRVTT